MMISNTLVERVLQRTIEIQQIPAPTFAEAERARFVMGQFQQEGLADVALDRSGNVYARLPGNSSTRPVVVSAHTDTVFPEDFDLSLRYEGERICGAGVGDNSLGVAGLFGIIWGFSALKDLPGDVWLVANSGEEGLGDLFGMRAVVDHFGAQPLAYVILEGLSLGQVYHRALAVKRYRIRAITEGGHSWGDYGRPSAIHELAGMVTQLTSLPLPGKPRTTLNIGVISGGTSVNTIAARAELELDLRSETVEALQRLAAQVEQLVQDSTRSGVVIESQVIGERPSGSLPAHHPLVQLAIRCLQEQGLHANLTIGSTDANLPLSQSLPAITIGLTTGGGAHTAGEFINLLPLAKGLAQLLRLVHGIFQL